jgi:HD-GYP domain-containing protein (c-di-GMP phosphodiesterase class II)
MKSYLIDDIPESSYFTKTVYLDLQYIVAAPEMPFTAETAKTLKEWSFSEVYSDGEPQEHYQPNETQTVPESITGDSAAGDLEKIQQAKRFYVSFREYVKAVYTHAAVRDELNIKPIVEIVKNIIDYVKEDRSYLMRTQIEPAKTDPAGKDTAKNEEYLISHTVYSTIIAIIIGTYLKLPNHRLIELGIAALVHEIGMIKLPSRIYYSDKILSNEEKKQIYTHPVIGYKILKKSDFPLAISVAVLEHHERENGTGYPRQLTDNKISLYAKIIAIACSYEAISSKRPHREAKDGYTSILELMKNEGNQYNNTVVRALVYSLSIYPIGMYVLLSNGKKGQVIDGNPEDPRYPVVHILGEMTPDGKNRTVNTSADGLTIARLLTQEEIKEEIGG